MKKICFITTISLTLRTFVLKTAEYLHENTDWDISFICNEDEAFSKELPEYIHFYPIQMKRGISLSGIQAMLEMKKVFQREKFDLIQYSTPNASLYAALAGFLAGIPVRLYCQWGMVFVGFTGIKRKIFKIEEKMVCRLSTHVEPDSYSNLNFAHEQKLYSKSKGSVIWNGSACGVDLKKFDASQKAKFRKEIRDKSGIPENAFVFGFVGRITKDKGVNELLAAFKKLQGDSYLLMVGPSEMDKSVDRELYDWSIDNEKIIYTGYTNTVERYLSAMDCYILPSYREGFGLGVVEAEAMGVPVIVTNIPGPIDAMEPNCTGIVVEPRNIKELAEAMNTLKNNKDIQNKFSSKGICFATRKFEQVRLFEHILKDRKNLML